MRFTTSQVMQGVAGGTSFMMKYAAQLPRTTASDANQQLGELAGLFRADANLQATNAGELQNEVNLRAALIKSLFNDHLAPIVATAQLKSGVVPKFSTVTMPRDKWTIPHIGAESLKIADIVTPYASTLVAAGLPTDFIDQLKAAVVALEATVPATRALRGAQVNATKALSEHVQAAGKVFRALDKLIPAELGKNNPALAEWKSMRRVMRSPSAKGVTPPTTPTPAPVSTVNTPVTTVAATAPVATTPGITAAAVSTAVNSAVTDPTANKEVTAKTA